MGTITPLLNNLVSLMCGILIFSTVFSVQRSQGDTEETIIQTLGFNGPGNTGLTFIWCVMCCCFVFVVVVVAATPSIEVAILIFAGCLFFMPASLVGGFWQFCSLCASHLLD